MAPPAYLSQYAVYNLQAGAGDNAVRSAVGIFTTRTACVNEQIRRVPCVYCCITQLPIPYPYPWGIPWVWVWDG